MNGLGGRKTGPSTRGHTYSKSSRTNFDCAHTINSHRKPDVKIPTVSVSKLPPFPTGGTSSLMAKDTQAQGLECD